MEMNSQRYEESQWHRRKTFSSGLEDDEEGEIFYSGVSELSGGEEKKRGSSEDSWNKELKIGYGDQGTGVSAEGAIHVEQDLEPYNLADPGNLVHLQTLFVPDPSFPSLMERDSLRFEKPDWQLQREETNVAEHVDLPPSETSSDEIDFFNLKSYETPVLLQQLGLSNLDKKSKSRLKKVFLEFERSIEKAQNQHGYLKDKVDQLENEKAELLRSLAEANSVTDGSDYDQRRVLGDTEDLNVKLYQHQGNCCNAAMLFNINKEQLRRIEAQQQLEVEDEHKLEDTVGRGVWTLQGNSNHFIKNQEIDDENMRNNMELTAACDREKELLQESATITEQLTYLTTDLVRSCANNSVRQEHLSDENKILKHQLKGALQDMATINTELAMTTTCLENEWRANDMLKSLVDSNCSRTALAEKEAELSQQSQRDTEKALAWETEKHQRLKEEHQRLKQRFTGDTANQRDTISCLTQKLAKAEAHATSVENLVHKLTLQLREKSSQLSVLQQEKDRMELAKKKASKLEKQKKSLETQLDQEITKNNELQKQTFRLSSSLNSAKRQLLEQLCTPLSRMEMIEKMDMQFLPEKDNLQVQLEY